MEPAARPLWDVCARATIFDLGQPLDPQLPVSPNHPGFKMALMRRHGDTVRADGGSAANEMIMIGGHTGTHVDALCHVSHQGHLHGDIDAAEAQRGGRFSVLGVETVPPIVGRGVLLDIAALHGVDVLAPAHRITADELAAAARSQGVDVREGDAVLIRSGWPAHWRDAEHFIGHRHGVPGPDEEAARWLAARKVRVTGAETVAYEWIPAGRGHALLPVHRVLLVEHGIYIVEMLDLTALAAARAYEFVFVLAPLKFVGATGSPVRPLALVP